MLWLPAVKVDVVSVALPVFNPTVPRIVAPSLKTTLPVVTTGIPLAALTTAVKVTGVPTTEGFREEVNTVRLASFAPVPNRLTPTDVLLNPTFRLPNFGPTLVGRN